MFLSTLEKDESQIQAEYKHINNKQMLSVTESVPE
jgi:hypothetical protein